MITGKEQVKILYKVHSNIKGKELIFDKGQIISIDRLIKSLNFLKKSDTELRLSVVSWNVMDIYIDNETTPLVSVEIADDKYISEQKEESASEEHKRRYKIVHIKDLALYFSRKSNVDCKLEIQGEKYFSNLCKRLQEIIL